MLRIHKSAMGKITQGCFSGLAEGTTASGRILGISREPTGAEKGTPQEEILVAKITSSENCVRTL